MLLSKQPNPFELSVALSAQDILWESPIVPRTMPPMISQRFGKLLPIVHASDTHDYAESESRKRLPSL